MLLVLWGISFALLITLFTRGYMRLHLAPATYEFHLQPFASMRAAIAQKLHVLGGKVNQQFHQSLHHVFHRLFHLMRRFHDKVFGKRHMPEGGTPSFFLKTIAEHKEEHVEKREMLS
jgi:hypothetical protein